LVKKISKARKKFYLEHPEELIKHGERTSKALKGRTKETHEHIRKHSEFMKSEEGKKCIAKGKETRKKLDELDPSRVIRLKEKGQIGTIKKKLDINEIRLILEDNCAKTIKELKKCINNKIDNDKINLIIINKEYWTNYINGEL
jgi:hypothetical protein